MSFEKELVAADGTRCPADFEKFWRERVAREFLEPTSTLQGAGISSPIARYEELRFTASDGQLLTARCVRPRNIEGPVPVVVSFYDSARAPRGWHHLTRWIALGFAVVQPERRVWTEDITAGWQGGAAQLAFARQVQDAARCLAVVAEQPFADPGRIAVYGEGLGAGLALGAAALAGFGGVEVARACLLNPLPADFRATWERSGCEGPYAGLKRHFRDADPAGDRAEELFAVLDYADGVNFALYFGAETLLGTSLMDMQSLPATQSELFNALPGRKQRVMYPKWGHERVNDFEDKTLNWLRPLAK